VDPRGPSLRSRDASNLALGRLQDTLAAGTQALARDRHQPGVRRTLALMQVRTGNAADESGRMQEALSHYDSALANLNRPGSAP
jgi:tetratricopeptide (TPR) repeat protein